MLVQLYNTLKAGWSRLNDFIMGGAPRRTVPQFPTPEAAAQYLAERCTYVPDPLGGALDWNVHPERLQAAMDLGLAEVKAIPGVDCDDWAVWAYVALSKIPECQPELVTLFDGSGRFGHHVICIYKWRLRYGAIDTNGHRHLPDTKAATLCRVWSDLYAPSGYRYIAAEPTAYPF